MDTTRTWGTDVITRPAGAAGHGEDLGPAQAWGAVTECDYRAAQTPRVTAACFAQGPALRFEVGRVPVPPPHSSRAWGQRVREARAEAIEPASAAGGPAPAAASSDQEPPGSGPRQPCSQGGPSPGPAQLPTPRWAWSPELRQRVGAASAAARARRSGLACCHARPGPGCRRPPHTGD